MSSEITEQLTVSDKALADQYFTARKTCEYSAEVGHAIIKHLLNGGSLRAIDDVPEWPDAAQVCWWMQGKTEGGAAEVLHQHYAATRAAQADLMGALVVDIIHDQGSAMQGKTPIVAHQNARVAMDGARWALGRMQSPRWAEPTRHIEHSGHVTLSAAVQALDSQRSMLQSGQSRAGHVLTGELVDKSVDKS